MFGVRPDRFNHEVEFASAVDLARYAVGHIGHDELGFAEVIEPVNALRVEIPEQKHRTRRVLRPREQKQMIGAEVKHGWTGAEGVGTLRPLAAPLRGSPGGLLRSGYLTERRLTEAGLLFRRIGVSAGLAQTVAAQQEDLGVLDQPIGNRSGDGRIKEDVAPVGKGCVRRNNG
jgi:hypothetical protein